MYVFSLAITDFMVGALSEFVLVFYTLQNEWPIHGKFAKVTCTIFLNIDYAITTISMIHMCQLGYGRYVATTKPFSVMTTKQNKSKVLLRILCFWFIGIAIWSPSLIYYHDANLSIDHHCTFVPSAYYVLIYASLAYYIPLIVMAHFCISIVRTLRMGLLLSEDHKYPSNPEISCTTTSTSVSNETTIFTSNESINCSRDNSISSISIRNQLPENGEKEEGSTGGSKDDHQPSHLSISDRKVNKVIIQLPTTSQSQNTRATRTIIIVTTIFILCWLPYAIELCINSFCNFCIAFRLYEASWWVAYFNSAINPIIYFIFNRDFRIGLKNTLRCMKI